MFTDENIQQEINNSTRKGMFYFSVMKKTNSRKRDHSVKPRKVKEQQRSRVRARFDEDLNYLRPVMVYYLSNIYLML